MEIINSLAQRPPDHFRKSTMRITALCLLLPLLFSHDECFAETDANRLTYLDGSDPYYVHRDFPKLITPQWVGEPGVETVVTLAIDDMMRPEPYENFLRPAMSRLKSIYGDAPLSIMTVRIDPKLPNWPELLEAGVSLECHTYTHPCPLLRGGSFPAAKNTYDKCVELMNQVPGNKPVGFRVPCCDSLNTPSPRFFAEIFNKTNSKGQFLTIDTSVFNLFTADDPELPRSLVLDSDGREKFRKYIPFPSFVNTIENYPYPYVIGQLCWEFPCVTPSDWSAQNRNGPGNPLSFRDLKMAVDATVIKQGVYNLVFHPVGWSRAEQIVELIDHCQKKHGKKVRFLAFEQVNERLVKNLLAGQPLRAANGQDNGVRLIDLNNDGYLDVVIGNEKLRRTRLWSTQKNAWIEGEFPVRLVELDKSGQRRDAGVRFGVIRSDGFATILVRSETQTGSWHFDGKTWLPANELLEGLDADGEPIMTSHKGRDRGVRLRDVDLDGRCELIVANSDQQCIFTWQAEAKRWRKLPYALPALTRFVDAEGRDAGLRFVDVNEDGYDDVIYSNDVRYSLHLYRSRGEGWSQEVHSGKRGDPNALPMIARAGTNNGAWFHSRHMWVQNEDTARLPNLVDRRSYNDLLKHVDPPPKSPRASVLSMKPRVGFKVELVAAEPLVQDPIAIAWGADGKLWVAEMGDYPLAATGGRVRFLEDSDGDGRFDTSTVFLDDVDFPTSVMPWRKGVLVTSAPDIIYAEDTDGDGRANKREVLFTGFVKGNQQHRLNGLRWGLDNWVYGANGDSGGMIKSIKTGKQTDIRGRDYRIRPDDGLLDPQSTMSQFCRARDDWGNWFGGNSGFPIWHCALVDHYLRRNPHAAAPNPRVYLMDPPSFARVYPISRTLPRFNDLNTVNRFTSACGAAVYRDDLFGENFMGSYFVCEPVHNLVQQQTMTEHGVTFTGKRAPGYETLDFLTSSDNWFRPTQVRTGPDGAIWVVDMYRQTIEHPQWIPAEWQQRLDLRAGHDKGRIYRVYPIDKKPRGVVKLDRLEVAELVAALDSPNGPQRDLAQQLLVERKDPQAAKPLEVLARSSKRAKCRLQALCSLDGLEMLKPELLEQALTDEHPAVRRHAIRLSEKFINTSPSLADAVAKRISDPHLKVQMQLAYTAGQWNDRRAGSLLGQLAVAHADNQFLTAAVMSSATRFPDEVLATVLSSNKHAASQVALIENLLVVSIASGQHKATALGLRKLSASGDGGYALWQLDALGGLLDALSRRDTSLAKLRSGAPDELKSALEELKQVFATARKTAANAASPVEQRLRAVHLLGRGFDDRKEDIALLGGLLVPQTPLQVQSATVTALGNLSTAEVPGVLFAGWKHHGPTLRQQVLDTLLSRPAWTGELLARIEKQDEFSANIGATHRQRLLTHDDEALRTRAITIFGAARESDRQKVVAKYQSVIDLKGDPQRGEEIFQKRCAVCHRLTGPGVNVGPDLRSLTDRSPKALLTAMLDPNRAVEAKFVSYSAVTTDGRMHSGILASETGSSITLIGQQGKRFVLPRADLEVLASTGKSLMPEGIETDMPKVQDYADLISYVRADHPPRRQFAGNVPKTIQPAADGSLSMTVDKAELFGPEIHYYTKLRVVGDWHTPKDQVSWSFESARAGKYEVWLEFACADSTAGNTYLVEVKSGSLTGKVAGTGSWQKYRKEKAGVVTLDQGLQSIVLRSRGPIKPQALFDLRSVRLVPVGE